MADPAIMRSPESWRTRDQSERTDLSLDALWSLMLALQTYWPSLDCSQESQLPRKPYLSSFTPKAHISWSWIRAQPCSTGKQMPWRTEYTSWRDEFRFYKMGYFEMKFHHNHYLSNAQFLDLFTHNHKFFIALLFHTYSVNFRPNPSSHNGQPFQTASLRGEPSRLILDELSLQWSRRTRKHYLLHQSSLPLRQFLQLQRSRCSSAHQPRLHLPHPRRPDLRQGSHRRRTELVLLSVWRWPD